MGFSKQEYRSGLPFPIPGDRPDPGIESESPVLQADSLPSEPPGKPTQISPLRTCFQFTGFLRHKVSLNASGQLVILWNKNYSPQTSFLACFWFTSLLFPCPSGSVSSVVPITMRLHPQGAFWEPRSLIPVFVPVMIEAYP